MKERLNITAFFASIVCILLVAIISFSGLIDYSIVGTHPLKLVLFLTLITLVLGVLGFSGIKNWKGFARSVTTIIITLGLSAFLSFVLFFGSLAS